MSGPGLTAARCLTETLRARAAEQPADRAYVFLDNRGEEYDTLTYGQLHARALALGRQLAEVARPGDRALLAFGSGPEFIVAYFACLYSWIIAVPVNPPRAGHVQNSTRAIVRDCEPVAVLTTPALLATVGAALDEIRPGVRRLAVDMAPSVELTAAGVADTETGWADLRPPDPEAIAFLQYTSGSTAAPKGVMVTHGNLAANQEMIRRAFGHDERSTVVGWAPFFHDQGLIGNVLQPLHIGATSVLMSPAAFIRRPLLWLSAISRYRARSSGGPNFAFDLCVSHAAREVARGRRIGTGNGDEPLDLSSWKVAFNGAEPIRHQTIARFAETFAPFGFRPETSYPCYGLAEATLLVTGSRPGRGPRTVTADRAALTQRRYVPTTDGLGQVLVGSGRVLSEQTIRIVDPATGQACPPGEIGEIWVSGPHVARGYWQNVEATAATFHATCADDEPGRRFLRTGDLGVLVDDELYVAGRLKDLIIIRGRNFYPQDIERTAEQAHPAAREGRVAAFAVPGPAAGERLVVVQEVRESPDVVLDDVAASIRAAVVREHDVSIGDLVLTGASELATTSSGKIMRAAARARYENGGFPACSR
ncbi:fatty acyl-AMP ligase [Parafrankia sp. EUN1f]|uniref:fatty acyl-AMP ligase n=1 Tax=Parafrankia sp. EUN1f TaxID=102897 RepID=UPI0001C46702|nr:fatty acyl-AMP ligase [Parafrankia sp. EUN1f]EFC83526.1 AMP-dependent synthetase and ligase [Parafrankia sp. EUN1f]